MSTMAAAVVAAPSMRASTSTPPSMVSTTARTAPVLDLGAADLVSGWFSLDGTHADITMRGNP